MIRGSQVWFNGKILSAEEAKISLFTHTLHYGVGAFEGIRAYQQKKGGGAIFRLGEHIERLFETCKILDLKIPYTYEEMVQATLSICKANQFEECYLRPLVFILDGPLGISLGLNPPIGVAILTWKWNSYLGEKSLQLGTRLKIASFIRPHVNSSMTKGKIIGQYVNNVMAKQEAIAAGFDEALLLDADGYLTEGTGENLFMIKNGIIKTTPLNSVLGGITRDYAMEYFRHKNYLVQETRFTRDELWCADEAFLTGTAAEITPISEIDYRIIGKPQWIGKPGPITTELQKTFYHMVRGDLPPFGLNWLTPI